MERTVPRTLFAGAVVWPAQWIRHWRRRRLFGGWRDYMARQVADGLREDVREGSSRRREQECEGLVKTGGRWRRGGKGRGW